MMENLARISAVTISCDIKHADELEEEDTERFMSEHIDVLGHGCIDENWWMGGVDLTFSNIAESSPEIIRRDVNDAINRWMDGGTSD